MIILFSCLMWQNHEHLTSPQGSHCSLYFCYWWWIIKLISRTTIVLNHDYLVLDYGIYILDSIRYFYLYGDGYIPPVKWSRRSNTVSHPAWWVIRDFVKWPQFNPWFVKWTEFNPSNWHDMSLCAFIFLKLNWKNSHWSTAACVFDNYFWACNDRCMYIFHILWDYIYNYVCSDWLLF